MVSTFRLKVLEQFIPFRIEIYSRAFVEIQFCSLETVCKNSLYDTAFHGHFHRQPIKRTVGHFRGQPIERTVGRFSTKNNTPWFKDSSFFSNQWDKRIYFLVLRKPLCRLNSIRVLSMNS